MAKMPPKISSRYTAEQEGPTDSKTAGICPMSQRIAPNNSGRTPLITISITKPAKTESTFERKREIRALLLIT
jgi:hypothetical protein